MLEQELARHFERNEFTWKLKGDYIIVPDESDILDALDKAAQMLYDSPVGTLLEVGRLIIIKTHTGHDVYALFGSYT